MLSYLIFSITSYFFYKLETKYKILPVELEFVGLDTFLKVVLNIIVIIIIIIIIIMQRLTRRVSVLRMTQITGATRINFVGFSEITIKV